MFSLEAGQEGEQNQGSWKERDEKEDKGGGGAGVTPSCLPAGKATNCTHSNKAIRGQATQGQSLYIQNSLTLRTCNQEDCISPFYRSGHWGLREVGEFAQVYLLVRGEARVLNPGVYKTKYSKERSAFKQLEICQVEGT